ncbi:MAG: hypothetical protein GY707_14265 [Desulfobacteraceae bacterium]|nr:hypothetical protein [Desulfobacteraceae bacterium]
MNLKNCIVATCGAPVYTRPPKKRRSHQRKGCEIGKEMAMKIYVKFGVFVSRQSRICNICADTMNIRNMEFELNPDAETTQTTAINEIISSMRDALRKPKSEILCFENLSSEDCKTLCGVPSDGIQNVCIKIVLQVFFAIL